MTRRIIHRTIAPQSETNLPPRRFLTLLSLQNELDCRTKIISLHFFLAIYVYIYVCIQNRFYVLCTYKYVTVYIYLPKKIVKFLLIFKLIRIFFIEFHRSVCASVAQCKLLSSCVDEGRITLSNSRFWETITVALNELGPAVQNPTAWKNVYL